MRNRLSSKGFTLVEVLVATGLIALVSLVMTSLMVKMQKDVTVYSAKSGVESLRNQVRMNAINGASILKSISLPENVAFNHCLTQTGPCTTNKVDYRLMDAEGNVVAGQNVFFDLQGKPCTQWSLTCPVKVTSQMQLVCPGTVAVPSCQKASSMNVFVQIDYHPDLGGKKGVELRPVSDTIAVALNSYYGTGTITNVVNGSSNFSSELVCEAGYVMTGVDANGKVMCAPGVVVAGGSGSSGSSGRSGDGDGGGGSGADGGSDGSSDGSGSCSM